jgi:hypothetical protein
MQEHDLIQQESNGLVSDQSVLEKINIWEKESIEKIKKTAEVARADFYRCQQSAQDQFKKNCNEFGENLRVARRNDDFSELDLTQWNQILINLKIQLESMTKFNIIEDRQSYITLIKIQQGIHRSANVPVQESSYSSTNNRHKNQALQNYFSARLKQKESSDNPVRQQQPECKQK